MLKLIRTTLNKKQTDFVNENRVIISKRPHDIPQELEHNSYLNRGNIEDTNKIASTITKNSQIYTPFIINPKNSQLENQKYKQEDLKQNIQESQSLTILKRHSRSKNSSYEDRQSEKNSKLFVAIRKKLSEEEIIEEIKKCLNDGADINAQNAGVKTVLHIVIEKDYKYVVESLLKQKGIKTNIPNKDGKIALDLAKHLNKQYIVQILENDNQQAQSRLLILQSHSDFQPGSSNQINQAKRKNTDSVEDESGNKKKRLDQDEGASSPETKRKHGEIEPKQGGIEQVDDYMESNSMDFEQSIEDYPRPFYSITGYETQQENGVSPENNPTDVSNAYPSIIGLKNNLHGIIYQLKLLMLFVIIGVTNNYQFRLATSSFYVILHYDNIILLVK